MGRRTVVPALVLVVLSLNGTGCSATRVSDFEVAVRQAYPAEGSAPAAREGLWALLASDVPSFRPLLRGALREGARDPGFEFEGARFLAEHQEGPDDFQLAVDVLARYRPEELPEGTFAYYELCTRLAREPVDATVAILRVLRQSPEPDEKRPLQYRQAAGAAALRLFLANGEDRWVPRLAGEVCTETDGPTALAIVDCLSWAATPEADEALRALAAGGDGVKAARTMAALAPFVPGRVALPRKTRMTRTREEFVRFLDAWIATGQIPSEFDEGGQLATIDFLYLVEAKDASRIRSLRRRLAPDFGCASEGIGYLTVLLRRAEVLAAAGGSPNATAPPPDGR